MNSYQLKDVIAFELGSEIVCRECLTKVEREGLVETQLLKEDCKYTNMCVQCDRCNKRVF